MADPFQKTENENILSYLITGDTNISSSPPLLPFLPNQYPIHQNIFPPFAGDASNLGPPPFLSQRQFFDNTQYLTEYTPNTMITVDLEDPQPIITVVTDKLEVSCIPKQVEIVFQLEQKKSASWRFKFWKSKEEKMEELPIHTTNESMCLVGVYLTFKLSTGEYIDWGIDREEGQVYMRKSTINYTQKNNVYKFQISATQSQVSAIYDFCTAQYNHASSSSYSSTREMLTYWPLLRYGAYFRFRAYSWFDAELVITALLSGMKETFDTVPPSQTNLQFFYKFLKEMFPETI